MPHRDAREQIDFVLRRHYSAAFTSAERSCVVESIRAWDEEHSELPLSERQRGWMAIARESLSPRWPEECVRVGG